VPRRSTTRTWSPKKNDNAKPGEEAKRGVPRSQAKSGEARPSEECREARRSKAKRGVTTRSQAKSGEAKRQGAVAPQAAKAKLT